MLVIAILGIAAAISTIEPATPDKPAVTADELIFEGPYLETGDLDFSFSDATPYRRLTITLRDDGFYVESDPPFESEYGPHTNWWFMADEVEVVDERER